MTSPTNDLTLATLPKVIVNLGPQPAPRLAHGHPWVYRDEIRSVHEADARVGAAAIPWDQVEAARCQVMAGRRFIGRGILNPRSMLAVRLLTRQADQLLDRQLIAERALAALARRRAYLAERDPATSACRLVHAEGDGLPGLIVDKFGPVLVFQSLALAAEVCRDVVLQVLEQELETSQIVERNDATVRGLEGLAERKGPWPPGAPESLTPQVRINEDGLHYVVDPLGGQKTGYYLDQRDNRARVRRLTARLAAESEQSIDVLDCFSYTGGFAVAAAAGAGQAGLGRLILLDSSQAALDLAAVNLAVNGIAGRADLVAANAFDWLREAARQSAQRNSFDLVVLDPPPFAPKRSMLPGALRGYKELNLRAMRLVRPGGILVTCTCSHHVSREAFAQVLVEAAADAGCGFRVLETTGQPADHPVLLGHPDGDYLRCLILEKTAP